MVLISLLFLCNHDNLITKLHQKKIPTLMKGGIFIGSFKFGSLSEMNDR